MVMWLLILVTVLAVNLAGLFYLITRISKFSFVQKTAGERKPLRYLLSAAVMAAGMAVIGFSMGIINLAVITIFLTLFWLFSEGMVFLLKKLHVPLPGGRCYLAGILALLFTAGHLCGAYYNAHRVVITDYAITTQKAVEPLRVVMFSDAHIGSTFTGEGLGTHVDTINQLKPDMVLIAGDLIDGSTLYEDIQAAAKQLGRLQTTHGVYFVFGNHDKNHYGEERNRDFTTEDFIAMLQSAGVTVLEDTVVHLPEGYDIIGRQDKQQHGRADIGELMNQTADGSFVIDINHQPNDYAQEMQAGADLVLSGHTHGGQFAAIQNVGLWVGANDRIYGLEHRGSTDFIVSSGISDWAMDFKTGHPSEIVLIDITPES